MPTISPLCKHSMRVYNPETKEWVSVMKIVYQVKWVPSTSEYWTDIDIDKDNSLNPSGDSLEALHRSLLSCAHAAGLKGFLFERGHVANLE